MRLQLGGTDALVCHTALLIVYTLLLIALLGMLASHRSRDHKLWTTVCFCVGGKPVPKL